MILLLCMMILLYMVYEKHCETKQIQSVSSMNWLTYEQIQELINKVKE